MLHYKKKRMFALGLAGISIATPVLHTTANAQSNRNHNLDNAVLDMVEVMIDTYGRNITDADVAKFRTAFANVLRYIDTNDFIVNIDEFASDLKINLSESDKQLIVQVTGTMVNEVGVDIVENMTDAQHREFLMNIQQLIRIRVAKEEGLIKDMERAVVIGRNVGLSGIAGLGIPSLSLNIAKEEEQFMINGLKVLYLASRDYQDDPRFYTTSNKMKSEMNQLMTQLTPKLATMDMTALMFKLMSSGVNLGQVGGVAGAITGGQGFPDLGTGDTLFGKPTGDWADIFNPKVPAPPFNYDDNPFIDIDGHWAKDDIEDLARQEIVKGYGDRTFRPFNPITREEVSTLMARYLSDGEVPTDRRDPKFNDTSGRWSYSYIQFLEGKGIARGYTDGSYRPANHITRAEFVALVDRTLQDANVSVGNSSTASITFTDTNPEHWASANIDRVASLGLINGYTDGSFKPDARITRSESAAIMNRLDKLLK